MNDRSLVPAKKKVKTGCRTCKIRHVKCDESRPACRRCVSTGRNCEGYGIWGVGAGNRLAGQITATPQPGTIEYGILTQFGKMSPQQLSCFSWFRYRTYAKLPLPFTSPFWNTLILQACTAEPTILHATLALGSAHRKETLRDGNPEDPSVALDAKQEFMLKEYSQAIHSLQVHLSKSQDMRSSHVVLATCALFTFFEYLLGRYAAANAHLHSGLKLLAEIYTAVGRPDTKLVIAKRRDYIDDWIIEVFARLHVQAALFAQGLLDVYPRLPAYPMESIPTVFQSTAQASNHMDRLMLDILHLAEPCLSLHEDGIDSSVLPEFQNTQKHLQKGLKTWLAAYNITLKNSQETFTAVDKFYLRMPRAYHSMFTIIINSLTWTMCEMTYDLCTAEFIALMEQLVEIWKAHIARPLWHLNLGMTDLPPKMAHSVGDKGWIPLLYFVAVKCRIHRVRLQALKLLGKTMHKEGIWDANIAIIIAKEVVRIEEGDFYQGLEKDDDFDPVTIATEKDTVLPPLPDCFRLYNIRVGLPDHPLGVITLEYDQKRDEGRGMARSKREYDLRAKKWFDTTTLTAV